MAEERKVDSESDIGKPSQPMTEVITKPVTDGITEKTLFICDRWGRDSISRLRHSSLRR